MIDILEFSRLSFLIVGGACNSESSELSTSCVCQSPVYSIGSQFGLMNTSVVGSVAYTLIDRVVLSQDSQAVKAAVAHALSGALLGYGMGVVGEQIAKDPLSLGAAPLVAMAGCAAIGAVTLGNKIYALVENRVGKTESLTGVVCRVFLSWDLSLKNRLK